VQRRYAKGVLTPYPKTVRSRRRVPLTTRALNALDRLPARLDTPILFPAPDGGHIDLANWRTREWYPALEAAVIDRTYGHLARDSESAILARLEARSSAERAASR
jgi:integrase